MTFIGHEIYSMFPHYSVLLTRINMESRKSPKLAQTSQELSRSPRLPKKATIRSPSLTRREFPIDGISEVLKFKFFQTWSDHNYTVKPIIMYTFQHNYLAQVTSNIWGTKFKIVGLASFLPANLGAGMKFLSKKFCFLYCSAHSSLYSILTVYVTLYTVY